MIVPSSKKATERNMSSQDMLEACRFYLEGVSTFLTVWKNDKFTATQILREINFGESTGSKSAIFPVLEALDF